MAGPVNQESPNTLLSDSTLKILDLLCEGPISGFAQKNPALPMDPLMSIYFDDVAVRNIDGSYNYNVSGDGFFYDYMLGSASQSGITGFQKVEVAVPLQSNTLISNPPIGAGPYKTVVTTINTDTYPDADSIRMTVRVPALYTQDANGNTNGFELSYAVDISLNNGAYVAQSPTDGPSANAVSVINGKCTTSYLQTVTYVLPKTTPPSSRYSWRIRVRRVSEDIQSTRTQNAIYVDSISVVSTNGYAYPNTAMSAISIASNQFSSIPTRSYDLMGMLLSVPNGYTPTRYDYGYETFAITGDMQAGPSGRNIGLNPQNSYSLTGVEYGMKITGVGIPADSYLTFVNRELPVYVSVNNDPTATANGVPLTVFSTNITPTITPASYPTIWTGDFRAGVWTDNPAWVFYDMVTDPVHGLGDYISASSVDKWTLYQIAQYCDEMVDDGAGGLEPRFTCNVAIQQPDQAYSVLLNLASTFRGMMYYANGSIQLSQTTDDKVPVYEFTNANVVNGSFSYSDTAKNTRSTVAMVKWRDPNNGFREAIQYIEDVEGIQRYGYVQKDVTAFACSSPGQAYRLGTWTLQTERLLTETVTFQTSLEGLYLRPGDNFAVYDNFRNNRGQGGRIVGFSTGRSFVDLDRPVTLDAGITYTLTAITPKAVSDPLTVTGSNQIDSIRQSQIETYRVIDTPGTYTRLGMAGQFNSSIYPGSPWILSTSGYTGIFNKASFYTCLATSEIEPGKIEVLGLQSNTGVSFLVSTGYTIVDDPPNNGDSTSIRPPSALNIAYQTGALADNTFYQNLYVTWTDSPDKGKNLSQYFVSGRAYATSATDEYVTNSNFTTWAAEVGTYEFNVAAVSLGGEISSYINASYTVPATNPFGRTPPLSGVFIAEGFDDYLFASNGAYTGFVGQNPTLGWNFQENSDGISSPAYDLVTGYQIRISGFNGTTNYLTSNIIIAGRENSTYTFPDRFLYTGLGGPARRGFDLYVDTMDVYGNIATGGRLKMNNPPPKPPQASGFVGFNGGFQYSFTPQVTDADISGVYLWYNNSPSFVPQFGNHNYSSPNLTDIIINDIYQINDYYMWFSLVDTFGYTGCNIYGPSRINPNGSFSGAYFNINQQLTLLAGGYSGLSGYTTGQIYQMNTIVATASGILAQQINSVSASVYSLSGYTTGEILDVRKVIVNTSGASAEYTNTLLAGTTGVNASVQIMAKAYVTGQTNGIGGAAVASWGFKLDAAGKVVSMRATTDSATEYGTIAFGGADLQSNSYVAGSGGWKIGYNGTAEFGNGVFRGTFTGGVAGSQTIIDLNGLTVGNPTADRVVLGAGAKSLDIYASNNFQTAGFQNVVDGANFATKLSLYKSNGSTPWISIDSIGNGNIIVGNGTINLDGSDGSINCDILDVDTTSNFDGIATFNDDIYLGNPSQARWLYFQNGGHIEWGLAGTMDTNLYRDGASSLKTDDAFTAASVNTTSSARFKDNISPLDGSMDMVRQLSGVRFDWNNKDLDNDIGLIAENVYSIAPTLVGKNSSGQIESVDYGRIAAILVEATKEIDARLKKVEEINGF